MKPRKHHCAAQRDEVAALTLQEQDAWLQRALIASPDWKETEVCLHLSMISEGQRCCEKVEWKNCQEEEECE